MIKWVPKQRSTAEELLQHPWLTYEDEAESDGYETISEESDVE